MRGVICTLEGHTAYVSSGALTCDGSKIVSGSEDNTVIKVWDTVTGLVIATLECHTDIDKSDHQLP
jgi:WD40 repeat protein